MRRTNFNFLVDGALAAILLAMIATGIILRFTLPPGSGHSLVLWNLSRHQWGDLHFWLALCAAAIVILHLALHWTWVVTVVRRWFSVSPQGSPSLRLRTISTIATCLIICSAMASFWWFSLRSVQGAELVRANLTNPDHLRGSMTLREAAAAMDCTTDQLRQRADLAANIDDGERLGQIATQQGITMQELRRRLLR